MTINPYEPAKKSTETSHKKGPAKFVLIWVFFSVCITGLLIALFLPAVRNTRPTTQRIQCANNLKQISLAMHNYLDVNESFPPAYTVDAEGRPLHSWRT